jgi:SAM-dependent methyltransferase
MPEPTSLEGFYDVYPTIEEAFLQELDESLSPRGPEDLYDLVAALELPAASAVVDVGCGEGRKAIELVRRFGFRVLAIDPVERNLAFGRASIAEAGDELAQQISFRSGRAEAVPVKDASIDLIWCNEVLMHTDLTQALAEFARVLRPGRFALVHQVFTGPHMGDREADAFWSDAAAASSMRPRDLEDAVGASGMVVVRQVEYGSEWGEFAEEVSGGGTRRLLHAARLFRSPQRYVDRFGETAYRIMLGDSLWHVYRMIGKLTGYAYVVQKPAAGA